MATELGDRRITGYPDDAPREKKELKLKTYEYEFPFNYPNVTLDRVWVGGERHGIELYPIKTSDGSTATSGLPSDWIIIEEDEPIVRIVVIGSVCTPPGTILVECDPVEGFRHDGENENAVTARFRVDNLWGMHLRGDLLNQGGTYQSLPISGMSCAVFEIPPSNSVKIAGMGAIPGWSDDNYPDDVHYSFRLIRTTVAVGN